jgi:4-methylaminobutanoate oxidase (formaldehyde-forming)
MLFHGESILRDDAFVGRVTSGAFGYTLGSSVGLAWVDADEPVTQAFLDAGTWEVEIATQRHAIVASIAPLYDPTGSRVRM